MPSRIDTAGVSSLRILVVHSYISVGAHDCLHTMPFSGPDDEARAYGAQFLLPDAPRSAADRLPRSAVGCLATELRRLRSQRIKFPSGKQGLLFLRRLIFLLACDRLEQSKTVVSIKGAAHQLPPRTVTSPDWASGSPCPCIYTTVWHAAAYIPLAPYFSLQVVRCLQTPPVLPRRYDIPTWSW